MGIAAPLGRRSGQNDEIISPRKTRFLLPYDLSQLPFHSVALMSLPKLPGKRETVAVMRASIWL